MRKESTRPRNPFVRPVLTALVALLLLAPAGRAQEAVRPSLAGEAAASARRQSTDQIPYNLLAGPVRFLFSITTGIEYNDNINLAETNKQEDIIIRPQFNIDAIWQVTQLNTLKLDIGLGYAFYLDHPNANTNGVLIQPGSQLSFDIFVQDFRINLHDRFSLQQDPVGQLQLSNVVDYGRFENTAGISVLWDLNKAVLTFGYDHYNYISTTSTFDYLNRNAEELTFSSYFAFTSTTFRTLRKSASLTSGGSRTRTRITSSSARVIFRRSVCRPSLPTRFPSRDRSRFSSTTSQPE